jgi:hypothetical protein
MGGSYGTSASLRYFVAVATGIEKNRRARGNRERDFLSAVQVRTFGAPCGSGIFRRAGVDLKPEYEVHNVVHAFSGGVPTVDLILAYHKANKSRS